MTRYKLLLQITTIKSITTTNHYIFLFRFFNLVYFFKIWIKLKYVIFTMHHKDNFLFSFSWNSEAYSWRIFFCDVTFSKDHVTWRVTWLWSVVCNNSRVYRMSSNVCSKQTRIYVRTFNALSHSTIPTWQIPLLLWETCY